MNEEIFNQFQNKHFFKVGKQLGKGGFGEVREIILKNYVYAGKLIREKKNNSDTKRERIGGEDEEILLSLKNPHVVRINKIYKERYIDKKNNKDDIYYLIIMEKAVLKDLKTFIKNLYNNKINYLIYMPFKEIVGDNFLKYLCIQIVKGLEFFERNEFIHFDIKPENILIFLNFKLKLSDFGLLKDASNIEYIQVPGGTPGYLPKEYYQFQKDKFRTGIAKKQDYFALGATIFLIKYGFQMIKYNYDKSKISKTEENLINQAYIVDLLQKDITFIRANTLSDRDFNEFLCSLINIIPEDRPIFEEIYRNKWLNKNIDKILSIAKGLLDDEPKLILELRKSDYLMEKKKDLEKSDTKKFIFKPKNIKKYK